MHQFSMPPPKDCAWIKEAATESIFLTSLVALRLNRSLDLQVCESKGWPPSWISVILFLNHCSHSCVHCPMLYPAWTQTLCLGNHDIFEIWPVKISSILKRFKQIHTAMDRRDLVDTTDKICVGIGELVVAKQFATRHHDLLRALKSILRRPKQSGSDRDDLSGKTGNNPTHTQCSTTEGIAPENRLTERSVGWKIREFKPILYWPSVQKSWHRSRRGAWTGDWCHAPQCWERYASVDEKVGNVGSVRSQTPTYAFQGSHGINSQNPWWVPTRMRVDRVNKIQCFPIQKCFGFYTKLPSGNVQTCSIPVIEIPKLCGNVMKGVICWQQAFKKLLYWLTIRWRTTELMATNGPKDFHPIIKFYGACRWRNTGIWIFVKVEAKPMIDIVLNRVSLNSKDDPCVWRMHRKNTVPQEGEKIIITLLWRMGSDHGIGIALIGPLTVRTTRLGTTMDATHPDEHPWMM